jgi:gamma-glutamyltranspeptidase / glutathione hydrolase
VAQSLAQVRPRQQALNMLERLDLVPMGYNSARYIYVLYQVMNFAYADRDFYYGDPDFPPDERCGGCCRKSTPKSAWSGEMIPRFDRAILTGSKGA